MRLSFYQVIKKIIAICTVLALCVSISSTVVFASAVTENEPEDIYHNEEEIDDKTGDVKTEEDNTQKGYQASVSMGEDTVYDAVKELFKYYYSDLNTDVIVSNVANGMYTNSSVQLEIGSSLNATLYRNGVTAKNIDMKNITKPGNYVLRIYSQNNEDLGSFSFRITDQYTNTSRYKIPEGFSITEAICNGMSQYGSTDTVLMEDEGFYSITIENDYTKLQYHYEATVDHTAPSLKLEAVNEQLTAKSAVDISDVEEGATLLVYWNDELIDTPQQLTTPGRYQLVLTDAAGNITTYQFVLYMYFTFTSTMIILFVAAVVIALVVYIIVNKKRTRVR